MPAATAGFLPPSPVPSPPERNMALKKPLGAGAKGVVRKLQRERTSTIASVFVSGEYSDVVIANNGVQYKVHRAIVCPQSLILESLLRSKPEEGQPGIVNLPGEEPITVRHMVSYFYYLDYGDIPEDKASGHECVHHAKMYSLADRYKIHGLRKLALARFQDAAGTGLWDKTSLLAVAREAYDWRLTSSRGLQDAVVRVFSQHKDELCQAGWKTDLQHMGELLYDMLVWENSLMLKEVEPQVPLEAGPETCPENPQEAQAEYAPEPEPEAPAEAPLEPEPEPGPEVEPEAKPEPEPEAFPVTKPVDALEPEPVAYPEYEPEVGPGPELEPAPEDEPRGFSISSKKSRKKKGKKGLMEPLPETEFGLD